MNLIDHPMIASGEATLCPRTVATYNPAAERDFSPLRIAGHLVYRQPLHGTPFTRYSLVIKSEIVGSQISYPSSADLQAMQRLHEARERTKRLSVKHADDQASLPSRVHALLKLQPMTLRELIDAMQRNRLDVTVAVNTLIKRRRAAKTGTGTGSGAAYRAL